MKHYVENEKKNNLRDENIFNPKLIIIHYTESELNPSKVMKTFTFAYTFSATSN